MRVSTPLREPVSGARPDGFTMIELLVVVVIAGVLLGIAVPSFNSVVLNSRQVSAANDLISSLHLARDLAVTRNVRMTVCPSVGGTDCEAVDWQDGWIVFWDEDGDARVDGDESIDQVMDATSVGSITSAEFSNRVTYRPNGRAIGNSSLQSSGQLVICDQRGSEHARVAIVDLSGRPRVAETTIDGGAPSCP